jgi:DNA-directed RNA polymerase specialized sigma24 family protein
VPALQSGEIPILDHFTQGIKVPTRSEGSVTCWIHRLKAGDQAAVQKIWERYYQELVGLARAWLWGPRGAVDEEDVAVNAFDSFFRGAAAGRFPDLRDSQDLWYLLVVITQRKACNQAKRECSRKAGGGKVRSLSALLAGDGGEGSAEFIDLISREPDPGVAVLVAEECQRLLGRLKDDNARKVVQWKMEGYTNAEIGVRIGRSEVAVERKLRQIRSSWEKELPP